jgi:hypothetical protein
MGQIGQWGARGGSDAGVEGDRLIYIYIFSVKEASSYLGNYNYFELLRLIFIVGREAN